MTAPARRRWLRGTLLAAALLTVGAAAAQLQLVVDGRGAGEVRNDLVPGVSYAPAEALADGFGARLAFVPGDARVTLHGLGRIVQIAVADDVAAATTPGATRVDGRAVSDRAALRRDDGVWLPVRPVAEAFGARLAFVAEDDAVVAVTRRATLQDAELVANGEGETVRLRFDAPARSTRYRNEGWGTWEWRFARVDLARARTLRGDAFERVDLIPDRGDLLVRVDAGEAEVTATTLPDGAGFEVRLHAAAAPARAADEEENGPARVVIDPGHGGEASGVRSDGRSEAELTLALARALRERLLAEGLDVRLTRSGEVQVPLAARSAQGAGADLFLSLHAAALPPGEARVWVLGDASDDEALQAAVRRNARDALEAGVEDDLRRAVLLDLVPDVSVGRAFGERVAGALFQRAGYRTGEVREAPLAVLDGAAGRGVLLEFALEDLADADLPTVLAEALAFALGGS